MNVTWNLYTLTANGVDLATILGLQKGSPSSICSKIRLSLDPTATGPFFKVQADTSAYSAAGAPAGELRGPSAASAVYVEEDQAGGDGLHLDQYFVCGAHAGDLLRIQIHV